MTALHYARQHAHEAKLAEMYAKEDMSGAPQVFYGLDRKGRDHLHVLLSREEWGVTDQRWHISISGNGRVPTWDEIAHVCHALRPGVPFVMGVPPRSQWLNIHEHVLHMWETKDEGLLEEWRVNARGDTPS